MSLNIHFIFSKIYETLDPKLAYELNNKDVNNESVL